MNIKTNKSGFTLTEILIVLVIAGILLALILPNSLKAIDRGNKIAEKSDIQSCKTALMTCYSENDKDWSKCADITALTDGKFLKEAPKHADGTAISVADDPDVAGAKTCI